MSNKISDGITTFLGGFGIVLSVENIANILNIILLVVSIANLLVVIIFKIINACKDGNISKMEFKELQDITDAGFNDIKDKIKITNTKEIPLNEVEE